MTECTLFGADDKSSAVSGFCWRGECQGCGWNKPVNEARHEKIRRHGLKKLNEKEVQQYISKNKDALTRQSKEHLRKNGLRCYKVERKN